MSAPNQTNRGVRSDAVSAKPLKALSLEERQARKEARAAAAAEADSSSRGRRFVLLAALLLALVFVGSLGVVYFAVVRKPDQSEQILASLAHTQRDWWDNEGVGSGVKDPATAFERLLEKQRGWWETQGLAKDGSNDPAGLARLEELEREWYAREGIAAGKPAADRDAVLGRLQDLNRQWLRRDGIVRANSAPADGAQAAGDDPDAAGDEAFADASRLKELEVKLLDKAGTKRFLDSGGSQQSEEAVQLGLQWLAAQQKADGSWGKDGSGATAGKANGVSMTALALLPFLARGETHVGSQDNNIYTKQVERGIRFLIAKQKGDGDLRNGGDMYTHALATMALCEALTMTGDPVLRGPAARAVEFLIKAQDPKGGGWRYAPKQAGDLSVCSWCLMALKSGQMAGIVVPQETLEKATSFLREVSRPDGGYGYTKGSPGHSPPTPGVMTAAGIVCRHYLSNSSSQGDDPRSANRLAGVDLILKNPPKPTVKNYYFWYYSMYAMLGVGGDPWKAWNPQVRDLVVSIQDKGDKNPALKGSWDPQGAFQMQTAGRVGVTALALLTLEVYYRHLPLNRPELGEMAKDLSKTTK